MPGKLIEAATLGGSGVLGAWISFGEKLHEAKELPLVAFHFLLPDTVVAHAS